MDRKVHGTVLSIEERVIKISGMNKRRENIIKRAETTIRIEQKMKKSNIKMRPNYTDIKNAESKNEYMGA